MVVGCTSSEGKTKIKPQTNNNGFQTIVIDTWLTPDQARKAAEIARKEIYNWLANHYRDYMHNPTGKKLEAFFGGDMINDLKEAMGDE